jgi:competence protein ComEC
MTLLLRGSISAPAEEGNPGEFSPRRYEASRGITGVLDVGGSGRIEIRDSAAGAGAPARWMDAIRRSFLSRSAKLLGGMEGEFLKDILLGERSGIPRETKEALIDAGVAHILAVSGCRVLIYAGMLMTALGALRIPRRVRPFLAVPALLFYMALAGCHPPVVRGTVMAVAFIIARGAGRRAGSLNALGLAALLILAVDPRELFDAGFQLSFGAVLAILSFMPGGDAPVTTPAERGFAGLLARWTVRSISLSVVVSLGTFPLTAALFDRVSIVGVLTNIVVVPASGAAMILGTIALMAGAISSPLGAAYAALDGLLIRWMIRFSLFAASLPFASVETGRFGVPETIAWYAAMVFLTRRNNRRRAAQSLAVLLASLNVLAFRVPDPARAPANGNLRVSMIDVGEGDAILIEFPRGGTLLVDAGPLTRARDAGRKTVLPFLKMRRIRSLDILLVTHPDADHAGGAASIVRGVPVGSVIETAGGGATGAFRSYHDAARERGSPLSRAWRGERIDVPGCARLYMLWPPRAGMTGGALGGSSPTNNASLVCKLVYGGVSFLFTGDAEKDAESRIVRSYGSFLRSDVLKVAHHGSDSGTSGEFLRAVRPGLALISAGLHNKFGHPSPVLLNRLHAAGARVIRTDVHGAVLLASDGRSVREISWR